MTLKSERSLTPLQAQRQARILACTRDLLAEQGYEGLQMRVLADRAGTALMTLYNRFNNKDDLILLALQELLAEIRAQAQATNETGIEYILRFSEITAEQILKTPKYANAMALTLFNGQVDSPIVKTLLLDLIGRNRQQVVNMIADGELTQTLSPDLLANSLSTCTWSTILLWMKGVICDQDFKQEYTRSPLLVLAPAMPPSVFKRYQKRLR
jgi:AcrR family transcriptional regulator